MKALTTHIIKILAVLILLYLISFKYYKRFDLTQDQRYSLSTTTKTILSKLTKPTNITIYLNGDSPLDFKRLQT